MGFLTSSDSSAYCGSNILRVVPSLTSSFAGKAGCARCSWSTSGWRGACGFLSRACRLAVVIRQRSNYRVSHLFQLTVSGSSSRLPHIFINVPHIFISLFYIRTVLHADMTSPFRRREDEIVSGSFFGWGWGWRCVSVWVWRVGDFLFMVH